MPEILTESFCERCGTRYTFESTAPKGRGISRFRTLSKGLRNFVMSDDTSLDEALAAARSDAEREVVSQQLDAFHKTFNFCMSCRQYTCANCWNEPEGRCLSCAPHVGHEMLEGALPQVDFGGNGAHADTAHAEGLAWPTMDLRPPEPEPAVETDAWPEEALAPNDLAGRLASLGMAPAESDAGPTGEPEVDVAEPQPEPEPEPVGAVAEARPEPEPEPVAEPQPAEPVEAVEAVAEARPEPVEAVAEPQPEPEPEPVEAVADAQPEPVEAVADARPEPVEAVEAQAEPEPSDVDDRAAAAAAQTAALLARFRPGQSIDDALAAYEAAQVDVELDDPGSTTVDGTAPPPPEPGAAVEPEPEPVAFEPEPVAFEPEPVAFEPEPVAFEPEPEPVAAVEPIPQAPAEPVAAIQAQPEPTAAEAAAHDRVALPGWRIVAPDTPTTADGHPAPQATPGLPAAASGEPQWPATPQWPTVAPQQESEALAFLTAKLSRSGSDDVWAASSREVLGAPPTASIPPAIQACVSCGLSLSANARFCRRCGTRQG